MNMYDIAPGTKEEMNVIVEVPRGSSNKYELDKETGLIALDRANYSAAAYPCEYAFIPRTLADDGDAIDVLVLATYPIHPGVLVKSRPVAYMEMIDSGESDPKIIAVPIADKRWDKVQDLADINPHTLEEIKHFFETYKALKGSGDKQYVVTIPSFKGKAEAEAAFERACKAYQDQK
ncbi:MAG TPA: inorganic diphosphatase [Candidatus Paceibacterota bacterium]|nr:inorganic diphosphatase [Candidatus Paceibacterota bacterium]